MKVVLSFLHWYSWDGSMQPLFFEYLLLYAVHIILSWIFFLLYADVKVQELRNILTPTIDALIL